MSCLFFEKKISEKKKQKGKWTNAEDEKVLKEIMKSVASGTSTDLNHIKWVDVSKNIDGRSGKQCRERYMNHLNPALQKGIHNDCPNSTCE